MILTEGSPLFGVAPRLLLQCAKTLHERGESFTVEEFSQALGAPMSESRPVFEQMRASGYLIHAGGDEFGPSELFNRLALARVGDGLPRKRADALLSKVLQAAHRINADPESFQCQVTRIAVFGSYLTDKDPIGDLDLAVEILEHRPQTEQEAFEIVRRIHSGRAPRIAKAYSALRLRKPELVSLHGFDELTRLGVPYKVVFPVGSVQQSGPGG